MAVQPLLHGARPPASMSSASSQAIPSRTDSHASPYRAVLAAPRSSSAARATRARAASRLHGWLMPSTAASSTHCRAASRSATAVPAVGGRLGRRGRADRAHRTHAREEHPDALRPAVPGRALGGAFVLAALAVPEADIEQVAATVNALPEVAHNYRRDHALNMWFVSATETPAENRRRHRPHRARNGASCPRVSRRSASTSSS